MNTQLEKDAAFYRSVCILRRLRGMGLLTAEEYEKIRAISQKRYGSALIVS